MRPSEFKAIKALAETLREELAALRQVSADQVRAIRDAEEAAEKNRGDIPRAIAATQPTEAAERDNQIFRQKNYTIQVILTFGTWCAFLAAAVYAGFAWRQVRMMNQTYCEIQRQTADIKTSAQAANKSADVAVASLRPWIKIIDAKLRTEPNRYGIHTLMFHTPNVIAEIRPQDKGKIPPQVLAMMSGKEIPPQLNLTISYANLGHSPANSVEVNGELFFHRFDSGKWHDEVIAEQQRWCQVQREKKAGSAARVVFPEDPKFVWTGSVSSIVRDSDIVIQNGVRVSSAALLLCINYKGIGDAIYQTTAWFGLYEKGAIYIPLGIDADAAQLQLIREENGDHAY